MHHFVDTLGIEGMLSKVGRSNKFSDAVMLGNNGSFDWSTQQECYVASGCQMLIMNRMNFYNLLYLSENLQQFKSATEPEDQLKMILKSSTHTCRTADAASHLFDWRIRLLRWNDTAGDFEGVD